MSFPSLYPILDSTFLPASPEARRDFLEKTVRELVEARVGILQYRNKTNQRAAILADASVMRQAAAGTGMKLILNDWPELLAETGFHGVHVGQTDMSPAKARAIVGETAILGVSTHNEAQLRAAAKEPVDYVAIGPVFATLSKENPDPVVGLEGVRLARGLTSKPIVAIGGISPETAPDVFAAGADSVALISAIFSPGQSPGDAAAAFFRFRLSGR
ncbi:thiamine phosphate synthase [Silvibacterium acidisoli]|uniref:thiamine phosphate synthase n=1 Tax=Acidobacteriaceae bacterium ZG23-2 TaxID=2883246 RepID=UPI00406D3585